MAHPEGRRRRCLYDYAAHPVNLLNWFCGKPESVSGTVMNSIFSKETDDEVSTALFGSAATARARSFPSIGVKNLIAR